MCQANGQRSPEAPGHELDLPPPKRVGAEMATMVGEKALAAAEVIERYVDGAPDPAAAKRRREVIEQLISEQAEAYHEMVELASE